MGKVAEHQATSMEISLLTIDETYTAHSFSLNKWGLKLKLSVFLHKLKAMLVKVFKSAFFTLRIFLFVQKWRIALVNVLLFDRIIVVHEWMSIIMFQHELGIRMRNLIQRVRFEQTTRITCFLIFYFQPKWVK